MNTSPIFENDPSGGVIVTDIFGGEHHFLNMEQAQTLTDFMSGLPIVTNPTSVSNSPSNAGHLPTDIHTLMICHFMMANCRMLNTGLIKLWMMQHIQQTQVNWKML